MPEKILLLDSGLGGLTVFREIFAARPHSDYVYVADDARFPYGAIGEADLIEHVLGLTDRLIGDHAPDLVVIPCNTASTIVLPALRSRFAPPFVGTVPAIKPACAGSLTRRVSVLGTDGTVKREYTRRLIRDFAGDCRVTLVGSASLAGYAEAELAGTPVPDDAILRELAPCFIDDGRQTDTVVLACTHYPLLLERFDAVAPWPVTFVDPAPAIARRVDALLGPPACAADAHIDAGSIVGLFTSGRSAPEIFQLSGRQELGQRRRDAKEGHESRHIRDGRQHDG